MNKHTKPARKIPASREGIGPGTLPALIEYSVGRYGGNEAYRTAGSGPMTYNDVYGKVTRFARHLRELGLGKGDHVAILGENRPEWGIAFFALSWIGAVSVPLDARASREDHEFILKFSSSKAVIASGAFIKSLSSMQSLKPGRVRIVSMDKIEEYCAKYSRGTAGENVNPDDLLEILFTSGTTGDPKGVMLSHGNVMSNVSDIYRITEFREDDRAFSILPIHHSYECTGGLLATFSSGMSVFYARSLKPRELLEDLKAAEPTVWLNTPAILERLYARIEKEIGEQGGIKGVLARAMPKKIVGRKVRSRLGLSNTRLIVSGGAALPARVSTGFENYGLKVIQGYGLSEASPLISVNPPSRPKHGSIGMIIPSDEVEIRNVDPEGNGEITVRGPNIMKGYYMNPEATRKTLTDDGWLLTGDLGYFDEDGYLYITGRKKYVIVTGGGKNIHPEEIEEKLCKSEYIEEAMVFSPDDRDIQALIFPDADSINAYFGRAGLKQSAEAVRELINDEVRQVNRNLEAYKRIRRFAVRNTDFPKTSTGKIKRYEFEGLDLSVSTKYE